MDDKDFLKMDELNADDPIDSKDEILNEDGKISVIEESLSVGKVREELSEVTINKTVETKEESVEVPLVKDEVNIERKTIGREIDSYPEVREENGVTIIPVVKEKIIVTKQLVLEEEIYITKISNQTIEIVTETIRKDVVDIDRKEINH